MSEPKHTPGPWRIRENPCHSLDRCDLSICGDIFELAEINGPQYAHQEANANLIAAAPELLAPAPDAADLLEHYADFIRTVKADDLERHPYLPEIERVAAELRAAITKATAV